MPKSDKFATGDLPDLGGLHFDRGEDPGGQTDPGTGQSYAPRYEQSSYERPPYERPAYEPRYKQPGWESGMGDRIVYEEPQKKKKGCGCGCFLAVLIVLILLAGIVFGACALKNRLPGGGTTLLLAGTDGDGMRTDTIILANIKGKKLTLMSIPRDTYTSGYGYSVPKINSAYGYAGRGEKGMEELARRVKDVSGVGIDGYVLLNFGSFEKAVDVLGGVDFEVPMDMHYEDPYQDLYIDLKAGMQHLDGKEALQVARFRSGYVMADLTRVEVQRDLLKACAKQWLTPSAILKAPELWKLFSEDMVTDLGAPKLAKVFAQLALCDLENIETMTLPGAPQTINGGSYFVPDADKVRETAEKYFK